LFNSGLFVSDKDYNNTYLIFLASKGNLQNELVTCNNIICYTTSCCWHDDVARPLYRIHPSNLLGLSLSVSFIAYLTFGVGVRCVP